MTSNRKTGHDHKYRNGNTPEQQAAADRRYRERQRRQRQWIAAVAEQAGMPKERIFTTYNAELVAEALRRTGQEPSEPPD